MLQDRSTQSVPPPAGFSRTPPHLTPFPAFNATLMGPAYLQADDTTAWPATRQNLGPDYYSRHSFYSVTVPYLPPYPIMSPYQNPTAIQSQPDPHINRSCRPGSTYISQRHASLLLTQQAGSKRSRLPSKDRARKTSCTVGPRRIPIKGVRESTQTTFTAQQSHPAQGPCWTGRKACHSRQGSKQACYKLARRTPITSPEDKKTFLQKQESVSTLRVRSRPIILDEDDDDDDDEASVDTRLPSIEICSSSKDVKMTASPRYLYTVPHELEGLARALGKDNWNDYLASLEKMCLWEITPERHKRRMRPLFAMYDDNTWRRMEKKVIYDVMKPVLRVIRDPY